MDTEPNFNELLRYDPETGGLFWRVTLNNRAPAGAEAGVVKSHGYRYVGVGGRVHLAHRLAWCMAYGAWPTHDVDHIDGDPSNNKLSNLRDVTRSINKRNAHRLARNTSGVTGVSCRCADSHHKTAWRAHWMDNGGKRHHKQFAVKKYGEETAMQLAIEYRAARIAEVGGYTARHGT